MNCRKCTFYHSALCDLKIASPRPRVLFSVLSNLSWRRPLVLRLHLGRLERRQATVESSSGSGQGQAWRRTLRRSRGGFGSGSCRPFTGRPPIIQLGHGRVPARRATRDGSKLPGGASFFRGIFSIRGARQRFGKALPGRCSSQIHLCAAFRDPESKCWVNHVPPLIYSQSCNTWIYELK